MKLSNQRIVLTGGTSGIGRELVRLLAPENHVVVLARQSTRSEALLLDEPGVEFIPVDLAVAKDVVAAGTALASGAQIHGLINCAAVQNTPTFISPDFDRSSIRREIDINLNSPCELIALLLPSLLEADKAFIMNVNSGLGLVPKTGSAIYCTTKGGLNIYSQALRNQLRATKVRVQQAFLPLVDTPMTASRGNGKLTAQEAARQIVRGIEQGKPDIDIGQVKLLRAINRIAPSLAARIMRGR